MNIPAFGHLLAAAAYHTVLYYMHESHAACGETHGCERCTAMNLEIDLLETYCQSFDDALALPAMHTLYA